MIARDVAGAEKLLAKSEKLERIVLMDDWIPADSRSQYQGDFYMVDVSYVSPVNDEIDSIRYLVKANSFTEIEEICKEETQETFDAVKSVDSMPYDVLGFKQEV